MVNQLGINEFPRGELVSITGPLTRIRDRDCPPYWAVCERFAADPDDYFLTHYFGDETSAKEFAESYLTPE